MYAPDFTEFTSVSVRRLAWALGMSMGRAVERMAKLLPANFDNGYVCSVCKDKTKCDVCAFSCYLDEHQQAALGL